jgi:hypothetical protein
MRVPLIFINLVCIFVRVVLGWGSHRFSTNSFWPCFFFSSSYWIYFVGCWGVRFQSWIASNEWIWIALSFCTGDRSLLNDLVISSWASQKSKSMKKFHFTPRLAFSTILFIFSTSPAHFPKLR